jgi:hypothetical protein
LIPFSVFVVQVFSKIEIPSKTKETQNKIRIRNNLSKCIKFSIQNITFIFIGCYVVAAICFYSYP